MGGSTSKPPRELESGRDSSERDYSSAASFQPLAATSNSTTPILFEQKTLGRDVSSSSSMQFGSQVGLREKLKAANLRAQRTIGCYLTYVIMIWLAIFVILYEISAEHKRPNHWLHIVMEAVISIFLLVEILVFMAAMGKSYFQKWIHVADLVITIGCALIFVGLLIDEMVESFEWPEEWELSILLVRYGLMACRLAFLCYRSGRADEIRNVSNIRFSELEDDCNGGVYERPFPKASSRDSLLQDRSRSEGASPGWMVSMPHPSSSGFWSSAR
mmetsp:Transcript_40865/g.65692  ORF Transcript_40865/g.65692 Transcript_40865/m.65692 type:complete len:273 (+) Transcript_40865:218-1036(+)